MDYDNKDKAEKGREISYILKKNDDLTANCTQEIKKKCQSFQVLN